MKDKFTWMLTPLLVLFISFSYGQEKSITGTVTDQAGMLLPGVSVVIVGTTSGTQTDFDGNYIIQVAPGQQLRYSYIGQNTVTLTVGQSNVMNVQMEEDAQALDEVVVVGYGTATRESFVGTATVVEAEDIELKNYSNISQALAGEAAGVNVINTSGQPGSTATVRIRGFGSVNGNRAPLYVVDGVPLTTQSFDAAGDPSVSASLNAINPADIKSTTILKDASATAIYGSRGANGVILITTKTGAVGESYITAEFKTGVNAQLLPRYDVVTSPEEFIGLIWEAKLNRERLSGNPDPLRTVNNNLIGTGNAASVNSGYNMWNVANGAELIDPATGQVRPGVSRRYTPERFADVAINPAIRTEANLSMGGGSEKTKYFASMGYLDDNGVIVNTGFQRYTGRVNVNSEVKEWLNISARLGYTYSESINNGQTDGAENLFEFADKMPPIYPVFLRDNDGNLVPDPIFGGNQYDYGSLSGFRPRPASNNLNPVASAMYDRVTTDRHEVVGSFNATFDITDGLTFETTLGLQYSNNVFKDRSNQFYGTAVPDGGNLFQRSTNTRTINFLQLMRYRKDFGAHSFEVLAAHESNDFEEQSESAFKAKAIIPGGGVLDNYIVNLQQPTGFGQGRTLESYFGQLNYDYDNKYYFTASVRRDGSSRFANDKWDTFGSVGASWIISNEDFLSNNDLLKFLKLKTSYGLTGDEVGVGFFSGINTFQVSNVGGEFAVAPEVFANPDLTWEVSKQYQAGLEFSLGNFLDGSVDYYIKDTENQFFARRIAPSTGIAVIDVNDGVLRNTGFEFNLTGHLVDTKDFGLDLTWNGEILNNEFQTMPIDVETGQPANFLIAGQFGYAPGSSIFDFYMRESAGVDPEDGYPLWNQYFDDANGNGTFEAGDTAIASLTPYLAENPEANVASQTTRTYADATQKFIGKSVIPDVRGAFRVNARYKNLSLSTQFTYSVGSHAYDGQYAELIHDNNSGIAGQNRHVDVRNRWRQPGDITDVPLIADRVIPNVNSQSSRFITSADFIALNNLVLNYNFSKQALESVGISGLSMYVSGDNLTFNGARRGFFPNVAENGNPGRALFAPMSTFTFGMRMKF